jgi:hypothetical protein
MERVAVSMLPEPVQDQIRAVLRSNLLAEGIRNDDLDDAVERGMDSWLDQLDEHENIPLSYKWTTKRCDCCGTYQGLDLNASSVKTSVFLCGPQRDCGENKKLRSLIRQFVYDDQIPQVCDAFGITMIVNDGKYD